eukprot:TRINITY_DN79236_c0_g1_i1.p1 TRINITY_DN79236_c0_g1~~TRINITY_DN79236_c0_g1_i1.p1  ORF type:complete len:396 (-),score=88.41 TRINITY_DN79236_c0_g1_i1:239-1399(-)
MVVLGHSRWRRRIASLPVVLAGLFTLRSVLAFCGSNLVLSRQSLQQRHPTSASVGSNEDALTREEREELTLTASSLPSDALYDALTEEERDVLTHQASSSQTIYVVSDSTGQTANLLLSRLLVQYPEVRPKVLVYGYIRTQEQIAELVSEVKATGEKSLIFATLVDSRMSRWLEELTSDDVKHINVMVPLLKQLDDFLQSEASGQPGVPRGLNKTKVNDLVNEAYFRTINAVQFAQQHVSGLNSKGWPEADLVLVGVSRVGKSSAAQVLAQRGKKVASVDLGLDQPVPTALKQLDPSKVVILDMSRDVLTCRRQGRLEELQAKGLPSLFDEDYADPARIDQELALVAELAQENPGWIGPVDCTFLAVEDCCSKILRLSQGRKAANA